MYCFLNCAADKRNPMMFSFGIAGPRGHFAIRERFDSLLDKLPDLDVLIHLPFGRRGKYVEKTKRFEADGLMELTSYIDCQQRGFNHVLKSFVPAWKDFPNRIIVYLGAPHNDHRIRKEYHAGPRRFDNILQHLHRSLRLPLELGADIAFDNAGTAEENNPNPLKRITNALMDMIDPFDGIKVFVEATAPYVDGKPTDLWDYGQIILADTLLNNRHGERQHPGAKGRFPKLGADDFYTEELIGLMTPGKFNGQTGIEFAREIAAKGIDPAPNLILFERMVEAGLDKTINAVHNVDEPNNPPKSPDNINKR